MGPRAALSEWHEIQGNEVNRICAIGYREPDLGFNDDCPVCGGAVYGALSKIYCSDECKDEVRTKRESERRKEARRRSV